MDFPDLPPDALEPSISFHTESLDFSLAEEDQVATWLSALLAQEGASLGEIAIVFCSDNYLHRLNVEHLSHDTYTDIITFPYSTPPLITGDLFISVERVADNARTRGIEFAEELRRVMAHGVLHLIGYGDKQPEEIKVMREKEDFYLQRY